MSLPASMAVVEMREPGGPDVLQSATRPLPVLQDHEILVKVAAAGVNGPDLVQRRGHYPPPKGASDLLGLEVSGEVVAVGAKQTLWAVGDKLCGLTNGGGYAEYVAIDATHCLPIPAGISLTDAAGLPETYFTVWSNVFLITHCQKTAIFWCMAALVASVLPPSNLARRWGYLFTPPLPMPTPAPIASHLARIRRSISIQMILSRFCVRPAALTLF